jgi:flagellar basal body-associated protein FliL
MSKSKKVKGSSILLVAVVVLIWAVVIQSYVMLTLVQETRNVEKQLPAIENKQINLVEVGH